MTENHSDTVSVQILNRQYVVRCPKDQERDLKSACALLNSKMLEISEQGALRDQEKIAVMAALNLSYELLSKNDQGDKLSTTSVKKIQGLRDKITASLAEFS